MSDAGQYQGSQAFSQAQTTDQESVNPNTGSLSFVLPLVDLRGVTPGTSLKLSLEYSHGCPGTFGLPRNWTFSIPYVVRGKSLTAGGRTYAIDPQWTDVTADPHYSGLRYENNHGIEFKRMVPPQELPHKQPGLYAYVFKQADGCRDYFDPSGKPLMRDDIFGNYMCYRYASGEAAGVESNQVRLDYIQDSWGQQVRFTYDPGNSIMITTPDKEVTTIDCSDYGVSRVTDSVNRKTTFDNVPFSDGEQVLSLIQYPTGLTSRYDYTAIEYLDQGGRVRPIPAVQDHFLLGDSDDQSGRLLRQTSYVYGETGQTFTGAIQGVRLGGLTDELMDGYGSTDEYRYDVRKTVLDGNGNKLAVTYTRYNCLHAPADETRFLLLAVSGQTQPAQVEAHRTVFSYKWEGNQHQRSTNYNRPSTTEVLRNTSVSPGTKPTFQQCTRIKFTYDEHGNTTLKTEEAYVGADYVQQKSVANEYWTNKDLGIQLLTKAASTDDVAKTKSWANSTVTEDGRTIASTSTSFRTGGSTQEWKKLTYSYDTEGRPIKVTTSWAEGTKVPEQSVSSSTNTMGYVFDRGQGILTVTTTDATNNTTTTQHDMRRAQGPVIRNTLPAGQVETCQHDAFGRLKSHTDALGRTTTTDYTTGPKGTSEVVTSPLRYVKVVRNDVLGREVQVSDTGDPTSPGPDAKRTISRKKYDALSRVVESTDHLGLVTKYTFDALDRPLTVTDAQGNVSTSVYDDKLHTVTHLIDEKEVRSVVHLDAYSRPISTVKYPDSSDRTTDYLLVDDLIYDGSGRVVSKTTSQKPKSGAQPIPLRKEETTFDPESHVLCRVSTGFGPAGQQDVVKRTYTYDLFNNVYTYFKETTYAGGQLLRCGGPIQLYDVNNRLATCRNQLGREERREYDANGWLAKMVRYDASEVKYSYNKVGQPVEVVHAQSTSTFAYNEEGRLVKTQEGQNTILYEHSLDGAPTKVTYSDGRSQSYTLDAYSRVVKDTDVFGVGRETVYDALGHVSKRTCRTDVLDCIYGTANHTKGQYLGCHMSGSRDMRNDLSYDGFGHVQTTLVKGADSKTLLETKYTRDSRGKICGVKSVSDAKPDLTQEKAFRYDGLGQLVEEEVDGAMTTYGYDGNSNVTTMNVDGSTTTMTYNQLDQRTDSAIEYDANGRMTKDAKGHQYVFDDRDRLVSVQVTSGKTSRFAYHADNLLSECRSDEKGARMFYDGGKVNALEALDGNEVRSHNSFLRDTKAPIASYSDVGNPRYFLGSLGSTALLLSGDESISRKYSAYGTSQSISSAEAATPEFDIASAFGFASEFTDKTSGLVYLRSRYYNPEQRAFICLDTHPVENKYAYCEGDPVNYADPTGHYSEAIGNLSGLAVGALVAYGVSVLVAGAINPALGLALAGAAGGVAGALAQGLVTRVVDSKGWGNALDSLGKWAGEDMITDVLTAAIGGALSGALGYYGGRIGTKVLGQGASVIKKLLVRGSIGGIMGSLGSGGTALLQPLITGRPFDGRKITMAFGTGFVIGAASGVLSERLKVARENRLVEQAGPSTRANSIQGPGVQQHQVLRPAELQWPRPQAPFTELMHGSSPGVNAGARNMLLDASWEEVGQLYEF